MKFTGLYVFLLNLIEQISIKSLSFTQNVTNDGNNECIERFEELVTSKRWHLDSQKNAKEYYTSTKLPQLKVLMLTTLSPAMSFEVNDEQGRE